MRKNRIKYFKSLSVNKSASSSFIPLFGEEDIPPEERDTQEAKEVIKKEKKKKSKKKEEVVTEEDSLDLEELEDSEEETEEDVETFSIKVPKEEFISSVNNLITHVQKVNPPAGYDLSKMRKEVSSYDTASRSGLYSIINYMNQSAEINHPIVNAMMSSKYYVVNEFQNLSPFFSGSLSSLNGNKIDPSKNPSEVKTILGVKINDFLITRKNYLSVANAFVSGVNSLKEEYHNNLNEDNLLRLFVNLHILARLSSIMNSQTSQYSSLMSEVSNPRKKTIKEDKTPEFQMNTDTNEAPSSSNLYVSKVDNFSGFITTDGRQYTLDYDAVTSGSSDFFIDFSLNTSVSGLDKESIERSLLSSGSVMFGNPASSGTDYAGPPSDIPTNLSNYITMVSSNYMAMEKTSSGVRVIYSPNFVSLLNEIRKDPEHSIKPIINIITDSNVDIKVMAKDYGKIKKLSESVSQTKYKVSVNGKKTTMSVAEIYMAKQSGKKVKVLGMQSLSDEVSKWNPKRKK